MQRLPSQSAIAAAASAAAASAGINFASAATAATSTHPSASALADVYAPVIASAAVSAADHPVDTERVFLRTFSAAKRISDVLDHEKQPGGLPPVRPLEAKA